MNRYIIVAIVFIASVQPIFFSEQVVGTRASVDDTNPDPEINITFDRNGFEIDPRPYQDHDTLVTGKITCILPESLPPNIFCYVYLTVISTVAISMEIQPYIFGKSNSEANLSHNVELPGDPKGDTTIDIEFEVQWQYTVVRQNGVLDEHFETRLFVPPFGTINSSLPLEGDSMEAIAGDWSGHALEIFNNNNMDPEMRISVIKAPEGMKVELYKTELSMMSYQRETIKLRVMPDGSTEGPGTIILGVDTDLPGDLRHTEMEVPVMVEPSENGDGVVYPLIPIMGILVLVIVVIMVLIFMRIKRT